MNAECSTSSYTLVRTSSRGFLCVIFRVYATGYDMEICIKINLDRAFEDVSYRQFRGLYEDTK